MDKEQFLSRQFQATCSAKHLIDTTQVFQIFDAAGVFDSNIEKNMVYSGVIHAWVSRSILSALRIDGTRNTGPAFGALYAVLCNVWKYNTVSKQGLLIHLSEMFCSLLPDIELALVGIDAIYPLVSALTALFGFYVSIYTTAKSTNYNWHSLVRPLPPTPAVATGITQELQDLIALYDSHRSFARELAFCMVLLPCRTIKEVVRVFEVVARAWNTFVTFASTGTNLIDLLKDLAAYRIRMANVSQQSHVAWETALARNIYYGQGASYITEATSYGIVGVLVHMLQSIFASPAAQMATNYVSIVLEKISLLSGLSSVVAFHTSIVNQLQNDASATENIIMSAEMVLASIVMGNPDAVETILAFHTEPGQRRWSVFLSYIIHYVAAAVVSVNDAVFFDHIETLRMFLSCARYLPPTLLSSFNPDVPLWVLTDTALLVYSTKENTGYIEP